MAMTADVASSVPLAAQCTRVLNQFRGCRGDANGLTFPFKIAARVCPLSRGDQADQGSRWSGQNPRWNGASRHSGRCGLGARVPVHP